MASMVDVETQKELIADLEARLAASQQEAEQVKSHLALATQSLKDISEEYTQMFGSYKGIDQVQNSLERVLDMFKRTESRVAALQPPPPIDPLPLVRCGGVSVTSCWEGARTTTTMFPTGLSFSWALL